MTWGACLLIYGGFLGMLGIEMAAAASDGIYAGMRTNEVWLVSLEQMLVAGSSLSGHMSDYHLALQ